jgi:hypothetical protein
VAAVAVVVVLDFQEDLEEVLAIMELVVQVILLQYLHHKELMVVLLAQVEQVLVVAVPVSQVLQNLEVKQLHLEAMVYQYSLVVLVFQDLMELQVHHPVAGLLVVAAVELEMKGLLDLEESVGVVQDQQHL